MNIPNAGTMSSIGVGLDIIGSYFLLQSFLIKTKKKYIKEFLDYVNGNPFRLGNAMRQRVDATTGFLFLFLGFLSQFIANLSSTRRGENTHISITISVLVLLLAVSIIATRPLKEVKARKVVSKYFAMGASQNLLNQNTKTPKQFKKEVEFWGEAIGLRQKKQESLEDYAVRLLKYYKT